VAEFLADHISERSNKCQFKDINIIFFIRLQHNKLNNWKKRADKYSMDYRKRAVAYKQEGHTFGNLLSVAGKTCQRVLPNTYQTGTQKEDR
jgi:hypothetical protein